MAPEGPQEDPDEGGQDSLKERLARHWRTGAFADFYATVDSELKPVIQAVLRRQFKNSGLKEHDLEDCYQQAVAAVFERQDGDREAIENPYSYIFAASRNAAIDFINWRKKELEAVQARMASRGEVPLQRRDRGPKWEEAAADAAAPAVGPELVDVEEKEAHELVEAILDPEVAVEPGPSKRVVDLAVSKLSPPLRRVVLHALERGTEYNSSDAPADLGMNPATYRSNKRRAFDALRHRIPEAIRELGITPKQIGIPDVLGTGTRGFPSADEENEAP